MRKKITTVILAAAMAMMLVGCGGQDKNTAAAKEEENMYSEIVKEESHNENATIQEVSEEDAPMDGAWEKAESPVITDKIKGLVEKANSVLAGAQYEAVALIGTQVVAGKNYRLLCKVTATVPDAKSYYALITLWEDPQGNVSITDTVETEIEAPSKLLPGGIAETKSPEMTTEATDAFNKATETITGESYRPVALIGTQVVAGTNYYIFCETKASTQGQETGYAIVTVYAGVDGTRSVINVDSFK